MLKKLWKTMKKLGATSKCKFDSYIGLKNGNDINFDGDFVSSKLVQQFFFFCNIASELVEKLPDTLYDAEGLKRFHEIKVPKRILLNFLWFLKMGF